MKKIGLGVNIEDFVQELKRLMESPTGEENVVLGIMQILILEYVEEQKEIRDNRTDGKFQWKGKYPYATVYTKSFYPGNKEPIKSYSLSCKGLVTLEVELSHCNEDTQDLCLSAYYNGNQEIHYCFENVY